ncbi:MAG TPA: Crp/Fnr family transcriptional regulator [Bryobacteraceae bacterium]|nr:Crp/Fnr family transcriptional regulator [Bryobacteraceae bacterium]
MNGSAWNQEDPLTYLPRKQVQEHPKGTVIYDPQRPSDGLYLVMLGRVKVSTVAEDGCQTIVRVVCSEGLFGESALVGRYAESESATALDHVNLMAWSRSEIEQQVDREPRLGIALSQYLVRQCLGLQDRIESMAVYKTPERVMLALAQLSEALGAQQVDGSVRLPSLTHNTLAEYVGTSREIVTFQMNRLRRMGLVNYSRKYIDVYTEPMQELLRQQGISIPQGYSTSPGSVE